MLGEKRRHSEMTLIVQKKKEKKKKVPLWKRKSVVKR